jgi:hypothetical protein
MDIEHLLNTYSLYMLIFGVIALAVLAYLSLKLQKVSEDTKKLLFLAIVLVTLIPTLIMSFSTVFVNVISSSGGPVHWHADIEVFACGREVNLKDPKDWWVNKIGSATLHEHNDKRIHLEGVVMKKHDASLGNFFRVIDGELSSTSFSVPTNEGLLTVKNGEICEGSGTGEVQVFVYRTDKDDYYSQEKVSNPQDHIIAPFASVPKGDCIVVEFTSPKERTDKICKSYAVAEKIGKLKGEKPNGN